MRWPYNARINSAHSWGMVASGIAIGGVIVTALTSLHGTDPHFRWWWPTAWMIAPVVIVLVGLVMVLVPLRRQDDQREDGQEVSLESRETPQSVVQEINADAPGATAQGAIYGNVINNAKAPSGATTHPRATESAESRP
jgi:sugar phosphate permease